MLRQHKVNCSIWLVPRNVTNQVCPSGLNIRTQLPNINDTKQFILLESEAIQYLNDTEVMTRQKTAVKKTTL